MKSDSFLKGIVLGILFLGAVFFIPWKRVDWGRLQLTPSRTVTVTGTAESQEQNQIASFSAGVSAVNDDKNAAIDEVNQKIKDIIETAKSFGIAAKDIETQNLSVHQDEEAFYEEGVQKRRPGQWRVNNTISVTLREIERAEELADLLTRSGATNVYGPNFRMDDTQPAEETLLGKAIENAREKAEKIAQASQGQIGQVISVTEGSQAAPVYRALETGGFGGGVPLEPGSTTLRKTVTVVFELK